MADRRLALTPAQQRQVLIGLLAVIALTAWWLLVLGPQRQRLVEREASLRELRPQVIDLRRRLTQLPSVEQEIQRLTAEVGLPTSARRPEEQLPDLLQAVTQLAQAARVQVLALKPRLELSALPLGPSGYLELPVAMQVAAGYHELGAFLDALERSPRLVRVGEFEIHPDPEDLWHHQAVVMLQVYLIPNAASGA